MSRKATSRNLQASLVKKLARNGDVYARSLELLKKSWNKTGPQTKKVMFSIWENKQMELYGEVPRQLFFVHAYLTWLMRTIRSEFLGIEIGKNLQGDAFSWIWDAPDTAECLIEMLRNSTSMLSLKNAKRDVFKDLYENLIGKVFRIRRGEYNTPDWLAQLMLEKTLAKHSTLAPPRVIDPACGTGTFILHAIKKLNQRFDLAKTIRIVGIDINPLMVEIAKTNYLLGLGKNRLILDDDSKIPIFCLDTLMLSRKDLKMLGEFDIVIGNPPWGSIRDIKNADYKDYIKKLAINAELIEKKDTHLYTQIEVSTVFFVKCIRFLKQGGTLAFIMPRSTIAATMQNYNFIHAQKLDYRLVNILDLDDVKPLFNMPTCVLMSDKNGGQTYPIEMEKYEAELPSECHVLTQVMPYLSVKETRYTPAPFKSKKRSYYYGLFKTGVSIFPRSFYFITPIEIHEKLIKAKTSNEILGKYSKKPWKTPIDGWLEREFLYCTVLGWEVLPYFYKSLRLVVLPIEKKCGEFHLLRTEDMRNRNALRLAEWFKKVDRLWCERRTASSEKRFPSVFDRLNYGNLLNHQSQTRRFILLYNATGRDLASCIVDRQNLPPIKDIKPSGFVADVKTWIYETNRLDEALYLCGVLNAPVINKMIKPLQPRGLGGARAVHRRPLMLNIPEFDESNQIHRKIAELSSLNLEAADQVKISRSRKNMKKELPFNGEIDSLVKKLLQEN